MSDRLRKPLGRLWLRLQLVQARDRLKMLRREKMVFIFYLRQHVPGTSEHQAFGQKLPWYQEKEAAASERVKLLERRLSEV